MRKNADLPHIDGFEVPPSAVAALSESSIIVRSDTEDSQLPSKSAAEQCIWTLKSTVDDVQCPGPAANLPDIWIRNRAMMRSSPVLLGPTVSEWSTGSIANLNLSASSPPGRRQLKHL